MAADRPTTEPRRFGPPNDWQPTCKCDPPCRLQQIAALDRGGLIECLVNAEEELEMYRAAEAAQGAAPLDYSLPPEVANTEVEWGGRVAAPRAEGLPRTYSLVGGGLDMFLVTDDESGLNIGYARKIGGPITAPIQGAAPRADGWYDPETGDGYAPDQAAPRGAAPRAEGLDVDRLRDILDRMTSVAQADWQPMTRGYEEFYGLLAEARSVLSRPSDERVPEEECKRFRHDEHCGHD